MNIYLKVLILIISTMTILSCRGGTSSSSTESDASSSDTSTGGSTGVVDNSVGFSISVGPTSNYTYIIHEGDGSITDDFTAPCSIDSSFSTTDMKCIIEAKELDLFYWGAEIRLNVPQNMCEYVKVSRPYYWNFIPGVGESVVLDNRIGSGDLTVGAITASVGTLIVGSDPQSSISCDYDYSLSAGGGPNCCEGSYTKYVADKDGKITITQDVSWGGSYSNCLAGPALQSDSFSSGFLGVPALFYVKKTGFNESYVVKSPFFKGLASNIYAANYFNPAEHGNTAGVPACMASPNGASPTEQYHEFLCLDRAHGLKGRIRVMVRDWDLDSEYELGVTGNPDTGLNTYNDLFNLGNVSAAGGDPTSIPQEVNAK